MRQIDHLSPTSIGMYYQDPEGFYLRYLADKRPPKIAQTNYMAVGAAFDAYIKSYLYAAVFGVGRNPKFDFDTLFCSQVEPQNRDFGTQAGMACFKAYMDSKAIYDLLIDLQSAKGEPRFETMVKGSVNGLDLMGIPDIHFMNSQGLNILLDWKVNGYCSKSPVSPFRGYTMIRDGLGKTRGSGMKHKDCFLANVQGMNINIAETFDRVAPDWSQQLAIYGWLCGEEVGSDFVVAVDQLCCHGDSKIRVASYRSRISEGFQYETFNKASYLREVLDSGHIFRDMTLSQSLERQSVLDNQHLAYEDGDETFKMLTGRSF